MGGAMFQVQRFDGHSSFRKLAFSEKVWRCLQRAEANTLRLEIVKPSDLHDHLTEIRATLDVADDRVVARLVERNPNIIQTVRKAGTHADPRGLLAILPLNQAGMDALTSGAFIGSNPEPNWIAGPGQQPAALYVWLVYMPGAFGTLLGAIAKAIDPMLRAPCPMFSRAVNARSLQLHLAAGFEPAHQHFPRCQADLLLVTPQQVPSIPVPQSSQVQIARTMEDMFQVFSVRSATYLAEQFCTYSEEFDGNDFCATQWLGKINGDAAGCIRARFFDGFAKLERLAVRAEYRNSRLSFQLVREAIEHCRLKGYRRIIGHSRLDLVRFWRVFGFRPMEGRAAFSFANVQYVELVAEFPAHDHAIPYDVDPMIVIRPEGAWDRPGPLDLSPCEIDPRRKSMLEARTRTIGRQRIAS